MIYPAKNCKIYPARASHTRVYFLRRAGFGLSSKKSPKERATHDREATPGLIDMGANQAVLAAVVLPAFFLPAFASARRSVFLRRRARFLALSLPLLCPIVAPPSSASRAAAIRSRILRQC